MAIEFSPNGRGIIVLTAILVTLLVWSQTSGAWLTLVVIGLIVGLVAFFGWGIGTRALRWVGGIR